MMENPFEQINERLDKIESSLQELLKKVKPPPAKPKREPIGINEAAKLLRLSKISIYTKVTKGELPAYKKGQKLQFFEDELLAWIESGNTRRPV